MSTPAQKANLARIRDNQRRSRARKREYLQDLEQRLRICELQGIEASAEVQMAARRVADENRQLRELLQKQGLSDEYINHYLQNAMMSPDLTAAQPSFSSNPGTSVQSLQQLIVPRRPNGIDSGSSFPLPTQGSRETSTNSASTANSSLWEGTQTGLTPPYAHQQAMGVHGGMAGPPTSQPYSAPVYSSDTAPQMEAYAGHQQVGVLESQRQQSYNTQQLQSGMPAGGQLSYAESSGSYTTNSSGRDYGSHGGF